MEGHGEANIKRIISRCVYKKIGFVISQYSEMLGSDLSESAMVQVYYLRSIEGLQTGGWRAELKVHLMSLK